MSANLYLIFEFGLRASDTMTPLEPGVRPLINPRIRCVTLNIWECVILCRSARALKHDGCTMTGPNNGRQSTVANR